MTNVARAMDGARIAWNQSGRGEPLLLISGQSVRHTAWDPILPALVQQHRVITFDHRGIGDSDQGSENSYSTRGFARDALAVLDAAGVDTAHVFGHSMGGRIAQWLAIDHPGRLGSVVLAATTAGDSRGAPRTAGAAADLASGDPDRLARQFFRPGHAHDAAAFFDVTTPRRIKRLHFQASRLHDTWDRLSTITSPTLIIHGTDDQVTPPDNAIRMAGLIPTAELILLPAARHGFHLDCPGATDLVVDFLRRHPIRSDHALTRRLPQGAATEIDAAGRRGIPLATSEDARG